MSAAPPPGGSAGCLRGALGVGLLLLSLGAGAFGLHAWRQHAAEAWQAEATAAYAPARAALEAPSPAAPDLDRTVRVLRELDLALQGTADMGDWLSQVAQHDHRFVDPRVLRSRARLMDALFAIWSVQAEREEREAAWGLSSELLLATLSVVDVQGRYDGLLPQGRPPGAPGRPPRPRGRGAPPARRAD